MHPRVSSLWLVILLIWDCCVWLTQTKKWWLWNWVLAELERIPIAKDQVTGSLLSILNLRKSYYLLNDYCRLCSSFTNVYHVHILKYLSDLEKLFKGRHSAFLLGIVKIFYNFTFQKCSCGMNKYLSKISFLRF